MWELPRKYKYVLLAVFAFCFGLIGWRAAGISVYDPGKARDAIHGDAYSDINTLSAAEFFHDFGFRPSRWLPVHGYKHRNHQPPYAHPNADSLSRGLFSNGIGPYTHYPSLPDDLAGLEAVAFNTVQEPYLRILPILLSAGFFFFIFSFLLKIFSDKKAAFLSACLTVLSGYFIFFSDTLHKHPYEEMAKWLFVAGLFGYYENGKRPKWLLALLGLLFIAATNVSFEPVTYLAVVVVGFAWIYDRRVFTLETLLMGLMPFIGLGLHLWQNAELLGGWANALTDMRDAFSLRTAGEVTAQNELGHSLTWKDYLAIPFTWLNRMERAFLIPGWALLPLSVLALHKMRRERPRLVQITVVLLLATLSWALAMTQHFTVHLFTVRHAGLFFAFVAGYGLVEAFSLARRHFLQKQWPWMVFDTLLGLYILGMAFSQQVMDWFRYGFLR